MGGCLCVAPLTHAQAVQQGIQQAADWLIAQVELDRKANGRFADHKRNKVLCELAQQIRALTPSVDINHDHVIMHTHKRSTHNDSDQDHICTHDRMDLSP